MEMMLSSGNQISFDVLHIFKGHNSTSVKDINVKIKLDLYFVIISIYKPIIQYRYLSNISQGIIQKPFVSDTFFFKKENKNLQLRNIGSNIES